MNKGMQTWRCPQCGVIVVTTDPDVKLIPCNLWHEPDGTDHRGKKMSDAKKDPTECTECEGEGTVDCPTCGGDGTVECGTCDGEGHLDKTEAEDE